MGEWPQKITLLLRAVSSDGKAAPAKTGKPGVGAREVGGREGEREAVIGAWGGENHR